MATWSPRLPPLQAVVIGGTGAIGRCLVGELLKEKERVGKVTVITRRKVDSVAERYSVDIAAEESSGRLVQHVENLDDVSDDTVKQLCTGSDAFFNCMGTTRKQAGSADAFRHIDYEIPVRLMKLSHQAGVSHCSVVTSMGANPNSWFLYPQTKGQIEEAVRGMEFKNTTIFRPSFLDREGQRRFLEKVVSLVWQLTPVDMVARAMLHNALEFHGSASIDKAPDEETEKPPFNIIKDSDIYHLYQESKSPE